jgi:hypothetical protein
MIIAEGRVYIDRRCFILRALQATYGHIILHCSTVDKKASYRYESAIRFCVVCACVCMHSQLLPLSLAIT